MSLVEPRELNGINHDPSNRMVHCAIEIEGRSFASFGVTIEGVFKILLGQPVQNQASRLVSSGW